MTAPVHKTLAEALAAAQADMPAVKPDSFNPHFKSHFVSLGHLIAVTRPVLNKHGLSIVQMPGRGEDGMPVLQTTITHVSGDTMERDAPLLPVKNDMQALGAAITYMRRFAWASACAISDQTDDDGEAIADRDEKTASKPTGATETLSQPSSASTPAGNGRGAASEPQVKMIHALIRELATADVATEDALREYAHREYGVEHITDLSGGRDGQASNLIERLQRRLVGHLYGELVLSDRDEEATAILYANGAETVEGIGADHLAATVKALKAALA